MTLLPQCFDCVHLLPNSRGTPLRCKAFPDEIPRPITLNDFDHRQPYEGDHGIRFQSRIDPAVLSYLNQDPPA